MCRLAPQDYPTQELPPRGVVWTPTKLTRFLDTHCVVACNKDGDHNMMSADCYRCEQRAHMHGQHTSGEDVYHKLDEPTLPAHTKWLSEGKQWMHHVRLFIMGTLPKSLHKPLVTFMGAFCLLAKNHKSTPDPQALAEASGCGVTPRGHQILLYNSIHFRYYIVALGEDHGRTKRAIGHGRHNWCP